MHEPSSTALIRGRPKTTYYHNGIGGRGNYHKRNDGPDTKQRRSHFVWALAALFSSGSSNVHHASEEPPVREDLPELKGNRFRDSRFPSRWFNGIGGFGNRRPRRRHSPDSDMSCTTVTSGYSVHPLPVGAADVMKRKILGERSAAKTEND